MKRMEDHQIETLLRNYEIAINRNIAATLAIRAVVMNLPQIANVDKAKVGQFIDSAILPMGGLSIKSDARKIAGEILGQ
jgi:hypothetical protein